MNSRGTRDILMEHVGGKCELYLSCCGCFIKLGSHGPYPSHEIVDIQDDYVTLKAPDGVCCRYSMASTSLLIEDY